MILPPTRKNKAWIKSLHEEGRAKRVNMKDLMSSDPRTSEKEMERLFGKATLEEIEKVIEAAIDGNAPPAKKRRRTKRRSTRSNIGDTL
tara:strand:+ start:3612 stop:3878 length:267 start_codon:yes stop_codon:yes gene_type:complete